MLNRKTAVVDAFGSNINHFCRPSELIDVLKQNSFCSKYTIFKTVPKLLLNIKLF